MNDAGTVVGGSGACGPPMNTLPVHAALWRNGAPPRVLTNTLPNGGSSAFASAVNNNGQVVGPATLAGDTVTHAFLWQEGEGMKDLGSLLPGDTFVFPQSINNRGEVVGLSCGSEPTATGCAGFYWRNGVLIDLNAHLTQPTSLQIHSANDINDSGEISVAAFDPNFNGGDLVPVVLVPAPGEVASQNSQSPSAAVAQRSVLRSDILQRLKALGPRGWRIAR